MPSSSGARLRWRGSALASHRQTSNDQSALSPRLQWNSHALAGGNDSRSRAGAYATPNDAKTGPLQGIENSLRGFQGLGVAAKRNCIKQSEVYGQGDASWKRSRRRRGILRTGYSFSRQFFAHQRQEWQRRIASRAGMSPPRRP